MKLSELHIKKEGSQVKCRCPLCNDSRSDRSDTSLSVNTESGHFYCHYCGERGILEEFKKISHYTPEEKEYSLPKLNTTGLGDEQLAYLFGRGIRVSTINRNRITQSAHGWIEFNYYEDDTLVNIKYRSTKSKKFMQHKGGKPVLYGLNDIIGQETVIICEGEIDKLSIEEAGFANCVSVPLGAPNENDNDVSGKLKCFEYARDYFRQVTEIIIAVDNDNNGKRLKEEIARRFGKHICRWVDFGKYKDANEVLTGEGADYLEALIIQAKEYPINNISDIADFRDDIFQLYDKGFAPACDVSLGEDFNKLYKVKEGYLSIVTGIPTHGKSVFVENMMINLIKRHGWKFGIYSPEHYPFPMFFQRIARIYTGKHFFDTGLTRMDKKELNEVIDHLCHYIFPMTEDSGKSLDEILKTYEQVVFKHGIKGLIIDPWTDLVHDMVDSETKYISDCLASVKRFNHKYDVHTWIIAHPTKQQKKEDGTWQVPTLYSISGSANWYNRADMGITVYRNIDDSVDVHVQKVKQEGIYGCKGYTSFAYDPVSCRYIVPDSFEDDDIIPF